MSNSAFVYKWTHLPTLKWYIGSRTAQRCSPDDGYICSSKKVKPLIESAQTEWSRDIIETGSPADMLDLETTLLELFDAKNDPRSYNQHNGDGRFTTAGTVAWNKGTKRPRGTPSWNSGKICPQISAGKLGKPAHNKGKPSPLKGRPNPEVGKARKSIPKDVCRIFDQREMSMIYYTQWTDKVDNPEKWKEINAKKSAKQKGQKQSAEWVAKRVASRAKTKGS